MDSIGGAPVMVAVAREGSDSAIGFGAAHARRTSRPLDLVHVAPAVGGWARQRGRDSLRLAADRARVILGPDARVRVEMLEGNAVPELVHATHAAGLVVLERRAGPVLRQLTHSTTVALASAVEVPLVSVPAGWLDENRRTVTVGLDPADPDDLALRAAIHHARLRTATLRVIMSTARRPDWPSTSRSRSALDARLEQHGADACDVAVEYGEAAPEQLLLTAAHGSDLLVLGRHRSRPDGSRLGEVTRRVLADAVCPVLLTSPAQPRWSRQGPQR
jgi:nucleotide-binding universal stress UspA family protein